MHTTSTSPNTNTYIATILVNLSAALRFVPQNGNMDAAMTPGSGLQTCHNRLHQKHVMAIRTVL